MCFYNKIKTLEKKTPTIIGDNLNTTDNNVIILQTTNQLNFSSKKLVVKVNFVHIIFLFNIFYFKRIICETLLFCGAC